MKSYYEEYPYGFRPVEVSDLPWLVGHRNDPKTWENLTHILPLKEHEQQSWLESLGEHDMYFIGMLREGSVGFLRINQIDWINRNAAVGLDIFSRERGRGHGAPLFKLLTKYCFEELNLHRLWLHVKSENEAARKIYVKAGFKEEGILREHLFRDGKYHDYIQMGVLDSEYDSTIQALHGS